MSQFPTHTDASGVVVVTPAGRLNMVAAPALRKELHALVEAGTRRVVVDLSGVEFIDSSGLGALISGLKVARQAGGDLRIAAPTRQVTTVLELTNLNRVLRAYPRPQDAFDEQS
ncbi:STAS domain-containing protein [Mycolicibacterium bacteremicum]|uniref:Anti-sigma factor antagonist n=1 Tax=Mycolicibacterium bacteremicum TaxID=564198 RepID=A0A1W9Z066_MYCBA|nr:STAS domain-containing protein [Mycolicibacterium bacteremicum]MCV7434572.1 STAS domain-containing protein [Mycolicibacterium bacteremicum]ORA05599.1 anti-anti-sigma factor [Mycolicibacterium bacteremicum]